MSNYEVKKIRQIEPFVSKIQQNRANLTSFRSSNFQNSNLSSRLKFEKFQTFLCHFSKLIVMCKILF